MEKIPTWIERMLLPKLGEIKAIHICIDGVEKEIASLRFDSLETRMPMMEKYPLYTKHNKIF
ncbi:MAG: hypothetical protein N2V78_02280 [Methanophagales archaeon]|nr:hypothetical protein [Methanophagales archaeon]MCW3141783.1 hypothetical protein [Methanophagales archaeon]